MANRKSDFDLPNGNAGAAAHRQQRRAKNFIGHIDSNNISRKIHNGLMKVYGYWDYTRYNTANIRCLCRDCLQIYKVLPEFTVTRVNPLSKVKDKCDKCKGFGYDYFVYERSPRPKGGKSNG